MAAASSLLSAEERDVLRRGCRIVVPGHPEAAPGDEMIRIGQWCRDHGFQPDRYGEGSLIEAFESKIAALLGHEAAVFMPSGTMAQQIALRIFSDRAGWPVVAMHPTAHPELHELRALSRLQRLETVPLGPRDRPTLAADLIAHPERLAALLVELPAREIGGQLPAWDELEALAPAARSRGIALHLDGARLWEAREAYAPRTYADIGRLFDSVYVSFYKGIGALAGAMLAGPADFVAEARSWRKRHGGTLVQLHPLVASAAMRFDAQLARMPAYRSRALSLADRLQAVPGLRILPLPPQVNMFHVHVAASLEALAAARDRIAQDDGAWLAARFNASPVPGWSSFELYVGDNLLPLPNETVAPLYVKLAALAGTAS